MSSSQGLPSRQPPYPSTGGGAGEKRVLLVYTGGEFTCNYIYMNVIYTVYYM